MLNGIGSAACSIPNPRVRICFHRLWPKSRWQSSTTKVVSARALPFTGRSVTVRLRNSAIAFSTIRSVTPGPVVASRPSCRWFRYNGGCPINSSVYSLIRFKKIGRALAEEIVTDRMKKKKWFFIIWVLQVVGFIAIMSINGYGLTFLLLRVFFNLSITKYEVKEE